ncbi:MAG: L-fuculose kinase [Spongiibacteraceae bacterium]|nr:L-fuculose kinase [Spongiibacteraceae bacterium]
MSNIFVFDVGKTHIKCQLLDDAGVSVFSRSMDNRVLSTQEYPCADTQGIWQWLLATLGEAAARCCIDVISISTHGATAALINRNEADCALVLPVLDYEYAGVACVNDDYDALRPNFSETYSPALPAGLNLGRQLYWQQSQFSERFAQVSDILLYPQYWAWCLTGQLCSEVSSLGCHTDLWSPGQADFSSLVSRQHWRALFPSIKPAWDTLGLVKPVLRKQLGLTDSCCVTVGVHDSNASFLRYKRAQKEKAFTVISTGTWSIVMASGVSLDNLDARRDTLANVDVYGEAVACARFMGGREYEAVCLLSHAALDEPFTQKHLQILIDSKVIAVPDFSGGSGPFAGAEGCLKGDVPEGCGAALASLYCALMLDYQLDLLAAQGDIFIEGAFLKNALLCAVLAQLRINQTVYLSADDTGTVKGCAYLADWSGEGEALNSRSCVSTSLLGLDDYKNYWRHHAQKEMNN